MNTRIKILELKIQAQRLKISFETVIKQIYETELKSLVKEEIKNTIESTQTPTLITTPIERSIKTINPKDLEKPIINTAAPQHAKVGSSFSNDSVNIEPPYTWISYGKTIEDIDQNKVKDFNDSVSIKSGSVIDYQLAKEMFDHPLLDRNNVLVINSDELNEVISM